MGWTDIPPDELNAFVAIFIVMGINKLPSIHMYWSENDMIGCAWISKIMSRNRFCQINRFLHVVDNALSVPKDAPGYNPMFKIQPLLDHMKNAFSRLYYPRKCISIDGAMIAFNGRLSFKQYIPSKPTKWGIKCWEVCDSTNGYCLDFNVYTGKNYTNASRFGVGYDVISNLSAAYFHKYHCVYFDRFFTGVDILEHLLRNGTYGCGTCKSNRKGLPKTLKNVKLRRGESKVYQKTGSNLMLTLFKDRKLVHMLSTNAQSGILPSGKPIVVDNFNKNMGGVDLNDQLCMYYKAGRPSHKWWRYIFWFVINVAMTNSWILFKESGRAAGYSHVKYCMELASLLRGNFSSRKCRANPCPSHLAPIQYRGHNLIRIEGRSRVCRVCSKKGKRTRNGYKKESTFECDTCKVSLCKGPCFYDWHTAEN